MSQPRDNPSTINANANTMATERKNEKTFTDIELGKNESPDQQIAHDEAGRTYFPSRRTSDLESDDKNYTTCSRDLYTPGGRRVEFYLGPPVECTMPLPPGIDQQRTSTLGKFRTRLATYAWLLPISAYLLTSLFALPGCYFLFSAFHRKMLTTGVCGGSISLVLSEAQILWIVYSVLWMVLLEMEIINRAFQTKGKGKYVKEAARICTGPLAVGMWMVVAAVIGQKVDRYCEKQQ